MSELISNQNILKTQLNINAGLESAESYNAEEILNEQTIRELLTNGGVISTATFGVILDDDTLGMTYRVDQALPINFMFENNGDNTVTVSAFPADPVSSEMLFQWGLVGDDNQTVNISGGWDGVFDSTSQIQEMYPAAKFTAEVKSMYKVLSSIRTRNIGLFSYPFGIQSEEKKLAPFNEKRIDELNSFSPLYDKDGNLLDKPSDGMNFKSHSFGAKVIIFDNGDNSN